MYQCSVRVLTLFIDPKEAILCEALIEATFTKASNAKEIFPAPSALADENTHEASAVLRNP
jgi:hypothetical protein